jgi:NAD dependent epimerase/dehydratase family enzyme
MSGGSGFLGSHLVEDLTKDGHQVIRLVRREARGPEEQQWDPGAGQLDPAVLTGIDAVINLSGAPVSRHWSETYRKTIRDSRVSATTTLARALAEATADASPASEAAAAAARGPAGLGAPEAKLPVFISASAIGFYGDTGDTIVDENSPAGSGFLSEVCQAWETACAPATAAGLRVVQLRTGLVLSSSGGVLKPLLPLFRLGMGSRFGSGSQWWPWITLTDWVAAVRFLLDRDDLVGPVNLVGPAPVTNADFTVALGRSLHRPTMLSVPATALRMALGGFEVEVLGSRRVLPGVLTAAGFAFQHRDLDSALTAILTTS